MTAPVRLSPVPELAEARWRVHLLGGFEIDDGRQRLTRLRSRASMALLARLAMAPTRAHARDELAALLWPEAGPDRSRSRLRQTLSLLRAVLEPPGAPAVLQADHWVIRVQPGSLWCDVSAFEGALQRRDLATALQLYRGELLPGISDEWVDDERRRLCARADALLDAAPAAAPRAAVHHLSVVPPLPLPPATRVPQAPQVPATARLPRAADTAFGLSDAIAGFRAAHARHRRLSVIGPAGIGKTRLVVEALGGDAADAPVRFVSLAGVSATGAMLRRLRAVLRSAGGPQGLEHLVAALDGTDGTLVLDGCEGLAPCACALLAAALDRLPRLRCVLTSRVPPGLPGEVRHTVVALPLPAPGDGLVTLLDQPAVALFIDRARRVRPEFHLHPGNAGALTALLQRLQGSPQAIEQAAAQMHRHSVASLLADLHAQEGAAPPVRPPRGDGPPALVPRSGCAAGAAAAPRPASN